MAYLRTFLFVLPIVLTFYAIGVVFYTWQWLLIPVGFGLGLYLLNRDVYRWIPRLGLSIDQTFNVVFYPYLNYVLDPKRHLFGHPDETVSSVVGKNLLTDYRRHWLYIEKLLVITLENGKQDHSIPAIEEDEGYRK